MDKEKWLADNRYAVHKTFYNGMNGWVTLCDTPEWTFETNVDDLVTCPFCIIEICAIQKAPYEKYKDMVIKSMEEYRKQKEK